MAERPHNSETLSTYSNGHLGCSQYQQLKDNMQIKLETHKDRGPCLVKKKKAGMGAGQSESIPTPPRRRQQTTKAQRNLLALFSGIVRQICGVD